MTWRIAIAMLALQTMGPAATAAQGLTLAPSFGTSVVFDDNVFQRPAAEGDLSVRFSPRLDLVRKSETLDFSGRLGMSSERFAEHSELTTPAAREEAEVDARYAASARLAIAATAAFTETETPSELNEIAVLTPGRVRARRVAAHSSATYGLGPRANLSVGFAATSDTLEGGATVVTQTATSSLERHLSTRTTLGVEYLEQRFDFGAGPANASRAITMDWTRDLTRGTTLTFRAGPRVTEGVVAPELLVTALRVDRSGSVALSYQQTQATLIGVRGVTDVRGLTATAERDVRRGLRLTASSGVLQTRQGDGSSLTYRVSSACTWRLSRELALEAAYDADRQHGDLHAGQAGLPIARRRVTLTLAVAQPSAGESRR